MKNTALRKKYLVLPALFLFIISVTAFLLSLALIILTHTTADSYRQDKDAALTNFFTPAAKEIVRECGDDITTVANTSLVNLINLKRIQYAYSNIGVFLDTGNSMDVSLSYKKPIYEKTLYFLIKYRGISAEQLIRCTKEEYLSANSSDVFEITIYVTLDKNFGYSDEYKEMNNVFCFLYNNRYNFIIAAGISAVLMSACIFCLIRILIVTGEVSCIPDILLNKMSSTVLWAVFLVPLAFSAYIYVSRIIGIADSVNHLISSGNIASTVISSVLASFCFCLFTYEVIRRIINRTFVSRLLTVKIYRRQSIKVKGLITGIYTAVIFAVFCIVGYNTHFIVIAEGILLLLFLWIKFIFNISLIGDTIKQYTQENWDSSIHGSPLIINTIYDDLNKIGSAMQATVAKSIRNERTKTELITNVSHDIKTPLTSIINYTDLLSREDITDEQRTQYLEILSRNSARMKKLIEDLIEVSKATTGNIELHMMNCNIATLVSQAVAEHSDNAVLRNLKIICSVPSDEILIYTDGIRLYRVFDNILVNACKYSLPGSRIYVKIISGEDVKIIFQNISQNEITISPEELTERFVRGDLSRHSEGSGLGLAIAKSLTELMGGTLVIEIDGDRFNVTLTFPGA